MLTPACVGWLRARAEMVAGFPAGGFSDSVEQAMAVALVGNRTVRHRPMRIPGRTRLSALAKSGSWCMQMEDDLSLDEMAQSVD